MRTDTAGICFVAVVVGLVESAGRESAAKTLTATTPIKVRLAVTRSATDGASCKGIATSCATF
jgi:hypothetical protein